MIERFIGSDGRRRLVSALCGQSIVRDDPLLADKLAKKASLHEFKAGETLIAQGDSDTDIYFVLSGKLRIVVNGRDVALRSSGTNVGEMGLIDISAKRSATVIASELSVVARISELDFTRLANRHPKLWRHLALELANRLRERERFHAHPNSKPVVFIGSSAETLPIAREIQSGLAHDNLIVKVWTDGIFQPSSTTLNDLVREIQSADFGVLVLGQDDKVISRDGESWAPRDNVIFELGLFIAALDQKRTLVVSPKLKSLKIPSDLNGINLINYELDDRNSIEAQLAPVCNAVRKVIQKFGPK